GRRVQPELQRIEIEPAIFGNHDFTVQYATGGQLRPQWIEQFREVPVQRFFIPALNQDFVLIAKNQRPKSVPFGFEFPIAAVWNFIDSLGEHRQYRGGNRKIHAVPDAVFATRSWSTDSNKGMSDRSVASVRNRKAFSRSRFSVAAKPPAFIAFTCQS